MKCVLMLVAFGAIWLWLTPDQQGRRLFDKKQYGDAAQAFSNAAWQGASWYRAGEYKKAINAFSRIDTPESSYNRGNALVMLGEYNQAVASYDQALANRPEWIEARENRELASARARWLEPKGGDMGDQTLGADKVVFDKDKESGGQDTELSAEQSASDMAVQAMWLRRVQTEPADFLKAKFAYQQALSEAGDEP